MVLVLSCAVRAAPAIGISRALVDKRIWRVAECTYKYNFPQVAQERKGGIDAIPILDYAVKRRRST